jgi:murein DD-endopeptidase MepM/ murein hydrolase activator NlpD
MKWLLTFLAGVVLGAGSLFIYLREIGQQPGPVTVVSVPAGVTPPSTIPPQPAVAGTSEAPIITTDLSEATLPLRPSAAELALPDLVLPNPSAAAPASGKLLIPVEGIKAAQLTDTFDQARGKERHHEALDIMAPKGTKVLAVADGKVTKLFNSKPGGLTVYQFDPTEKYAYYYAHLDRYAEGIKEGNELKRGDLIGYVGVTGNAAPDAPHLHFAVVELTAEKQWWKGTPVNPFPLLGD